jgi:hypothetical protein
MSETLHLYSTQYHDMKIYGGTEAWVHAFLTLALEGGEWSVSLPGYFTPEERAPPLPIG